MFGFFDTCIGCRHPLHCRTVQQCCILVEPAIPPEIPVRSGPPTPTKRGSPWPEPFVPCLTCHDPLHCGSWQACASTTVLPHGHPRARPPKPTARHGAVMIGPGPKGVEVYRGPALVDVDYTAIEKRVMARMASINGAAEHVVLRFHELTKTESGTPLFRLKSSDGGYTPTTRLLFNLVVEAIQGEVTL